MSKELNIQETNAKIHQQVRQKKIQTVFQKARFLQKNAETQKKIELIDLPQQNYNHNNIQTVRESPYNQLIQDLNKIKNKQNKDIQNQKPNLNPISKPQNIIYYSPKIFQQRPQPNNIILNQQQKKQNLLIINSYSIDLNHVLGKGSYSTVYLGFHQNRPQEKLAIKQIWMKNIEFKYIQQEIQIMKKIQSIYVVKIYDAFIDSAYQYCYLVFEFCNQGSLHDMDLTKINLQQKFEFFRQILIGLNQLHSNQIIHRDLKLANILVHNQICKIADFGFAKILDSINQLNSTQCGTPATMAPEIQFPGFQTVRYDQSCDIWSLGIILHELIYCCHPFNYNIILMKKNKRVEIKDKIDVVESFIEGTLKMQPMDRMSWKQIFQHPMFTGTRQQKDFQNHKIETPILQIQEQKIQKTRTIQEQEFPYSQFFLIIILVGILLILNKQ